MMTERKYELEPITGEVLARWPLTKKPTDGAKSRLTPIVAATICETIADGNYIMVACQAAGIHRTTYDRWMRFGEEEPDGAYGEFVQLVETARAQAEAANVRIIRNAAETTWQAAAWLLERQYPDRWGRRERVFSTVQGEHRVIFAFEAQPGGTDDGEAGDGEASETA